MKHDFLIKDNIIDEKNQECFKYNITWEQERRSFKINNSYNHNDLAIILYSYWN